MFLNFPLDPRISIWMFFIRFVLVIIGAYVPKLHFKETRDGIHLCQWLSNICNLVLRFSLPSFVIL